MDMKKVAKENAKSRLRALLMSGFIAACVAAGFSGCSDPVQSPLLKEIKEEVEEAKTPPTYKVTYLPNGADGGEVPVDPSSYKQGEKVTVLKNTNGLTKTGKNFYYWAEDENGDGKYYFPEATFIMGSANVSLYAVWTDQTIYTVTFDSKGGSAVAAQIILEGGTATQPSPSPTRTGYTFGGWYQEEEYINSWNFITMPINGNLTLYAKWTAKEYTVTFDAEGGTAEPASVQVTFDEEYPTLATTEKPGYVFAGWWTGDNGTGSQVTGGSTTVATDSDHTLYAKWTTMVTEWASTPVTAPGEAKFLSTAVSPKDGSVYCAGYISGTGTYDFGNGKTVTGSNASQSVLLVKYNASGVAQWAKTVYSGANISKYYSVAVGVDSADNEYVVAAGIIEGTGDYYFDIIRKATGVSSSYNAVLVKYDSSGTPWYVKSPSVGAMGSEFLSVAAYGNYVCAVGRIQSTGNYTFGSHTINGSASASNAVAVKYTADNLTAEWAKTVTGGSGASTFHAVAADSSYNFIAAGSITGTNGQTFSPVTATGSSSDYNAVIVKYDTDGDATWAKTVSCSTTSISQFLSLALDASGNPYAAGYIYGNNSYNFGGASATGVGEWSPVLVSYNSDGSAQWARTKTSGGNGKYYAVAVDSSKVYAAGEATGTTDFGGGIITAAGGAALVRYDTSGNAERARTPSITEYRAVASGSGGVVYTAGSTSSGTDFGDGIITTSGGTVLVKYEE